MVSAVTGSLLEMLCKLNQSWSGGDYLKPTLMAVLAPASVTFSYAAIALFYRGFLIAGRHLCLSCSV